MSQCMRLPIMWYVQPAKPLISLRIRAVWSEPLLVAWVFYDCKATDWTPFGVSKLKRMLHRLVWVYTCQNVTLLESPCTCSNVMIYFFYFVTSILIRFSYTFLPTSCSLKMCFLTVLYHMPTAFCFSVLCSFSYWENWDILSWVGSNYFFYQN